MAEGVTAGCRRPGEVLLDFPRSRKRRHQTAASCEDVPRLRMEENFAVPGFVMDPLLVGFVCVNPRLGSTSDSVCQLKQTSLLTRFDGGIILKEIFGN